MSPRHRGFSVTWRAKWVVWIMLLSVRGALTLPHVLDLFPQIRRRRPTPATLVLTSDQSSPGKPQDGSLKGVGAAEDRLVPVREGGC